MKKVAPIILIALLIVAGAGCQKAEEDAVIARVNGVEIRRSQFQEAIQRRSAFIQQQGQPVPPDVGQQALQLLIQDELLYQEGSKLDIPDLELTVEQRFREFASRFPSEEILQSSLKQMNTTPEKIRRKMRKEIVINNLVENEVGKDITVPEGEVKSYYKKNKKELKKPETVHARHILIALPPSPTEEEGKGAEEKIAEIKKKLKEGETFEELAMIYSDCPSSSQGGDLGNLIRGRTAPEFEKAAFSAKKGRVVGPVKTNSGLHLIRVESRESSRIPPFKEVKEEIAQRLRREKINERMGAYLGEIAAQSRIEVIPQQQQPL